MSPFDIAVGLAAVGAMVFGFRSGLIRSAATIVAYLCAAPIAMKATALISQAIDRTPDPGSLQTLLIFFGVFVLLGVAIAAGFNAAIDEMSGADISLADRLAGSMLGMVRVGLIAVTAVLVLDRIVPAGREPAFLAGSQLRPLFSRAAQWGLKSLPPETASFIDQIKSRRQS
jgi:membrane protein required for colicin V production